MAGLLTSDTDLTTQKPIDLSADPSVSSAKTTTYDPTLRTVNPGTETVSGQLSKILSEDSPYLTQARGGAMDYANSRGLLNSTMAAEAGESAAIKAALPVASADANVYGNAATQNQQVSNTAGQFNAGETNTTAKFNTGETNAAERQVAGGQIQAGLVNLQAEHQQILQSSAAASSLFADTQRQVAAILADPNTAADVKQQTVAQLTGMLKTSLSMLGSMNNIDIASLVTFQ